MTYEEAKAYGEELMERNKIDSDNLKFFDEIYGRSSMGLTPDHVKALPEWKEAKETFNRSFAELRSFNAWFTKTFKKEYMAERRNRRYDQK